MPNPDYVKAKNRQDAVARMIERDPVLSQLYDAGPNKDGKGGWVNMIRDQRGIVYRLLFYLDRIRIADSHSDQEPYEVVFGEIDPKREEPNYPRALYTTTGAVNLSRDGIPGDPFPMLLKLDQFEIVPFGEHRDLLVSHLWDLGYVYVCIYDKEHESLRILDLREYTEIYFVPQRSEIQVRNEDEVLIGDMTDVQPFCLRLSTQQKVAPETAADRAAIEAERMLLRERQ